MQSTRVSSWGRVSSAKAFNCLYNSTLKNVCTLLLVVIIDVFRTICLAQGSRRAPAIRECTFGQKLAVEEPLRGLLRSVDVCNWQRLAVVHNARNNNVTPRFEGARQDLEELEEMAC